MNLSSITKKIHSKCRAPESAAKFGSDESKKIAKWLLDDILTHGFIALKEVGFISRQKYSTIAANLAEYTFLSDKYPKDRRSIDLSELARSSRNMDVLEAANTIPALVLLFFKPQPEIYNNMMKTPDGCDFMEWLGVGEGGMLSANPTSNFSYERHVKLSKKFFGDRLPKGVHIPHWLKHVANVTSITTLQHQICSGTDSSESRRLIARRLGALLEACGQHVDYTLIERKLDAAVYPFPGLWKQHGVVNPQQFLGYTVPWNCVTGSVATFTWGESPLRFYFDNKFFSGKPLEQFSTLNDYMQRLNFQRMGEDRLCSEAMLYLIYAEYENTPPAQMYQHLYHANKTSPLDFQNPIIRHYLASNSPDVDLEFDTLFKTAVDKNTAKGYADNILHNLKSLKPQLFRHHADAYMMASPKTQAIRKLFPYLEDPNRFAERLPSSLLEDQLGADLGL